ncbi:MAG: hypothetical protein IT203_12545 [Fimbriimonadaceae bacterium]|nr:hypothetical protein [Fimbriimonadaceae bacterium]
MSLTVTRARIKEKCAVDDSSFDTPIDNILADYLPAIEYAIQPGAISDLGNTGLQATLNLGALEICCGEFVAQRLREPGAAEGIELEGIVLTPFFRRSARDPSGLVIAGWARLKPFLKAGIEVGPISGVLSAFKEVEE